MQIRRQVPDEQHHLVFDEAVIPLISATVTGGGVCRLSTAVACSLLHFVELETDLVAVKSDVGLRRERPLQFLVVF